MSPNRQNSTSQAQRMFTRSMSAHSMISNEDQPNARAGEKGKIQMIESGNRIGKREGPNFAARIRQEGKKLPPKRLKSITDLFQEIEVTDKCELEMSDEQCSNCREMNRYLYECKEDENYMESSSPEGVCSCYTSKANIVKHTREDTVVPVHRPEEEWTNVSDPTPCRIVHPRTTKQWSIGQWGIRLGMSNRKDLDRWVLTGSQTGKRVYIFSQGNDSNRKYVTVNDRNKIVLRANDVSPNDINVDTDDEIGDRRAFYAEDVPKRSVEGHLLVPAFKQGFAVSHGGRHLRIMRKDEKTYTWEIL